MECVLKFMSSKKATKIDEIFTINLTVAVKLTVKILSFFVAFVENMNFNCPNIYIVKLGKTRRELFL